ncbi:PAS domain-containing protein [Pseudoduganella buxea]|nr:PAS domain S-box protein [Pseudoduganella buxea]
MADSFEGHSFSRMVEKVSDYAIFLLDRDGAIQTWNPAAEAMKGYLKHEAVGRNFSMLYTQEDQQRNHPRHNLDDAAAHGTFQESAWRQRKDGSLFWALVEVIAIRDDNGELEGFCKLTRDLTNLKQLQETLAAEKERAELTLGSIADGVVSVNGAGLVEYVNRQAQRFTGWSQEEAKGLPVDRVFDIVSPGDYSAEETRLAQAEMSGKPPRTTRILRARDGTRHVIEARQSEIAGKDGEAGGMVIVFHDVGERQGMEKPCATRTAARTSSWQCLHTNCATPWRRSAPPPSCCRWASSAPSRQRRPARSSSGRSST